MKRELLALIAVTACSWTGQAAGQAPDLLARQLEAAKVKYAFANWPGRTGKVVPGVPFTAKVMEWRAMTPVWSAPKYRLEDVGGATFVEIRQSWQSEEGRARVAMAVGPSFEAAKQYLVARFAHVQASPLPDQKPGRDVGLDLGNVCFVLPGPDREHPVAVDFIRDNVVVMIQAEGNARGQLPVLAKTFDRLLVQGRSAKAYGELPQRPTIERLAAAKAKTGRGEEVPLTVEVAGRGEGPLHYFWTMTGGGVTKGPLGDFTYQAEDPGKQRITLTVVNELGLLDTKSIELEVVRR